MEVSSNTVHRKAADDSRLKREIGTVGLLFTAVGSIIGSGWLFGALNAAEIAGPASIIAWALGGFMVMMIGLCYAELGTMFPVSGGVVRFPHYAFGSFASYTLGWITWLSCASVTSIEVLATLQYSTNFLPWLMTLKDGSASVPGIQEVAVLTTPGLVVAIVMLGLFSLVNVIGVRWFAKLNNALVWWKLAIILLVIAVFLVTAFHGSNFVDESAGGFMPYGWTGVFSSIATAGIVFSYLGFRQGVELAGETDNPQRNVPLAIIGSVIITALIYIGLQIAFIGALPPDALAGGWANIGVNFSAGVDAMAAEFGPLAALASIMGLAWLAALLYIDAVVSPADTGLIYTTVTSRVSYAMGRNGNAPRSLAKVNDRGVPWISVILTFIAGIIFFLPFPGWQQLVGFVTSATVLSFGSGPLVLLVMRKHLPRQERPFRLPMVNVVAYLGFLASNLIVYWSGWDITWKLLVAVAIGYIVLIVHELRYGKTTPKLEYRSGMWVPVWLVGLAVISWLGIYPDVSEGAGNLGIFGFGTSILVLAVYSAFIMWLALKFCLSPEKIEQHLDDPTSGTPAEPVVEPHHHGDH